MHRFLLSICVFCGICGSAPPDEPVVLVDAAGKEIKLTGVKLTAGTRRLGWLADPKGTTDDGRKGLLALAVREPNSTTFTNGVLTLIPTASVEAIRYEYDKLTMTVTVKGLPAPVPGTLQFRGINVIGLQGAAGDVPAKFAGGVPKDGFRSVLFPAARPLPTRPAGGTTWAVQIEQPKAGHPTLVVRNLKALYSYPGGVEQLADALPVRKGDPLILDGSLKKLEVIAVDQNTMMAALEVTTAAGPERLVAVPLTRADGKRTATLTALVGEVDCGWKLFPLHTVKVVKPVEKP